MIILNQAICIQAKAGDLSFLDPLRNRLKIIINTNFQQFRLSSVQSQIDAKNALALSEECFVVILAHGGSDYLLGGDRLNRIQNETIEGEKFLTLPDFPLFKNKVVFCLSCNSCEWAEEALKAEAIAFVGFDQIPFDRYDANGVAIGGDQFTRACQSLILSVVQATLERFISGQITLFDAVELMRLRICQNAVSYAKEIKNGPQRKETAALLLRIKDGVRYYGNQDICFEILG